MRHLFSLSEDDRQHPVKRSTERINLDRAHPLARHLLSISERHGVDVEHDPVYGRTRAWVHPRPKNWPTPEKPIASGELRSVRSPRQFWHWVA
ncbi:hypothetical protein ACIQU3_36620 [Streptomyces sp. NPDC101110]|uniref:hypothetical protein n=1 Tax=Streptomyces sp. NPDC101110 TaxID=3366104 RepID=UPI003828CC06